MDALTRRPHDPATVRSPWLTIEGVLLIILGLVALWAPFAAGLAVALILGWILLLSGAAGLIAAIIGRDHMHFGWGLASAVIALVIGLAILLFPVAGAVGLSLLIGCYLLFDGITLIASAMDQRRRHARRWGWLMAAGAADIILAVVVVMLSAAGSAILIGVIIGIDLVLAGAALVLLHRAGAIAMAPADPGLPLTSH